MLVPILHRIHRFYVSFLNIMELLLQILVIPLKLPDQNPTSSKLVLSFIALSHHFAISFVDLLQLVQYIRFETVEKGVINRRNL